MLKLFIRAENIVSVDFIFTTNIYQQENSDNHFKIVVLNNSSLVGKSTTNYSYIIWD